MPSPFYSPETGTGNSERVAPIGMEISGIRIPHSSGKDNVY
jgi:hypothetical protein